MRLCLHECVTFSTIYVANPRTNPLIKCLEYSHVVSLPLQSVMEVANFCAMMDTLVDRDE